MTVKTRMGQITALLAILTLTACSGGSSNPFAGARIDPTVTVDGPDEEGNERETVWDLFRNTDNPNTTIEVNKYLWQASLEVLNFLPIQSVDPFSGVITTGFGTPPGGGTAYRATVLVQDPALEARALKLSMSTRSGPVSNETIRAVEDAILTRARQLRIRDSNL